MIRDITATASEQVHDHNDLVDALEKLHPGTRAPEPPTSESCSAAATTPAIRDVDRLREMVRGKED